VRRATSLVPLATLPGLLTRASLLFCNLAGSANPCELTFLHRRFAEPPRSCLLRPCEGCQPVRVYFSATLQGLLTRAILLFCNLAGSPNPCELTFLHRKFAEPPPSCL
ncbi:hypothetical protein CRG98_039144, partial [Punica granatum]